MSVNEERGRERRQFVRYTLKARADVIFDGQMEEHGELDNISTGGMFVALESEIPEKLRDKKVNASIRAISAGEEVTIEAECSIVRVQPDGVAFFFASIDSDNRKILHDLIGELNDMVRDNRK